METNETQEKESKLKRKRHPVERQDAFEFDAE